MKKVLDGWGGSVIMKVLTCSLKYEVAESEVLGNTPEYCEIT